MAKLERPFPSCPGFPGRFVLYISRRGDTSGNCEAVVIFAAKYSTKKWLELLLDGDGVVFEFENYMRTESGWIIENRNPNADVWPRWHKNHDEEKAKWTLQEVWEHEYTLQEMAWRLPHPYDAQALRLRQRRPMTEEEMQLTPTAERKRRGTPRASRDGLVPISDLAVEFNVTPRDCRAAFRKAKIPKPPQGWAWKADEVDAIREKLKELL